MKAVNDELMIHVQNGTERMHTGQELTLVKIIRLTPASKAFWGYKISPTDAGSVISERVKQNLLPLAVVGKTSSNSLIYRKL